MPSSDVRAPTTWSLDADRIQLVLVNVLRNALQASGEEGTVEARVSPRKNELVFEVRPAED